MRPVTARQVPARPAYACEPIDIAAGILLTAQGPMKGMCQTAVASPCSKIKREWNVPKIRHLAVMCMNPEKLAKFYCEVFDMEEVGRTPRAACSSATAI